MGMPVSFAVKLPVSFLREDKHYIAYTSVLDLSTSGKSFEQAKKRFEEVVGIFFEELVEKGTLDEVLTGLGWQKLHKSWIPPVEVAHRLEQVQVPLTS